MAEYIDRELAKNAVSNHWMDCSRALEEIMHIPAAGVAPVVLGNWVVREKVSKSKRSRCTRYFVYECPLCGKSVGKHRENYCPRCGAKLSL